MARTDGFGVCEFKSAAHQMNRIMACLLHSFQNNGGMASHISRLSDKAFDSTIFDHVVRQIIGGPWELMDKKFELDTDRTSTLSQLHTALHNEGIRHSECIWQGTSDVIRRQEWDLASRSNKKPLYTTHFLQHFAGGHGEHSVPRMRSDLVRPEILFGDDSVYADYRSLIAFVRKFKPILERSDCNIIALWRCSRDHKGACYPAAIVRNGVITIVAVDQDYFHSDWFFLCWDRGSKL